MFLKTAFEKKGTPLPEGAAEGGEAPPAEGEEQKESERVFEESRTYVHVRVSVDESIVPPRFKQILQPRPHELVEKKPPQPKIPHIKNPEEDFRRQLRLAVESILKEYYTMFREELDVEAVQAFAQEKFEYRKEKFLYDFNTSGKYHILKEKLKKTIVRIVRETFKRKTTFKGLFRSEEDQFYTTLYSHLIEQLQVCFRDLVAARKDELHENVVVSGGQYTKEMDRIMNTAAEETNDQRYVRLSREYEMAGDYENAVAYFEKRIEENSRSVELWEEYARFAIRMRNDSVKAERCWKEVISLVDDSSLDKFLLYGAFLVQQNRKQESLLFLKSVASSEDADWLLYVRA